MKEKSAFPTVFWILAGLLALGWALLLAGGRQVEAFPSASSFSPSGTAALAELLRREGYDVRIDTADPPALRPSDVAVCAFLPASPKAVEYLERHFEAGGRVLALPLARNFEAASRAALGTGTRVEAEGRAPLTITSAPDVGEHLPALIVDDALDWVPLWTLAYGDSYHVDVAYLTRVGRGVAVVLSNGLHATNRFLDAEQNAALVLDATRAIAPRGSQIVFVEASIGNARAKGALAKIGPWASGAGIQTGILLFVIAFALGRRFGLPETSRATQRGARELVDAIGNVYVRARATPIAMAALAEQADHLVRSELKLPRDATVEERNRRIPEPLALALLKVEAAASDRIPHAEALALAQRLDHALEEAFGSRATKSVGKTR